jgi:hypothetical protein
LTLEQSDWLDTLNAAGVPAVVVRPADYDEMIASITSGTCIGRPESDQS